MNESKQLALGIDLTDQNREKIVLLLNSMNQEGIVSLLKSNGQKYKHKYLYSKPSNWVATIRMFDEFNIVAVLAKFSAEIYKYLIDDNYNEVKHQLLARIACAPHQIYVYEDLLSDKILDGEEIKTKYGYYLGYLPNQEIRRIVNKELKEYKLQLIPYRTLAEITITAQIFLNQIESNLIFRVYIPKGRLWQDEIDKLLTLFTDYLGMQSGQNIRLDQIRTNMGTVYAFYGDPSSNRTTFSTQLDEFTNFLDLCVKNPEAAHDVLINKNVDSKKVTEVITRYAKESKRIKTDMRHAFEQKALSIRQRMESELIDVLPPNFDEDLLSEIAKSVLINTTGFGIPINPNFALANPATNTDRAISLNIKQQYIDKVYGIVAQEVQGDANYNEQEMQLLELFMKYGDNKNEELISALNELRDQSLPSQNRVSSKQKILSFLTNISSSIGSLALQTLQKYIESKYLGL